MSRTLFFVHTKNDYHLVTSNSNKLLYTSDTTSRELREQDHAVDVIVLQQLDIGAHLGDL